MRLLLAWQSKMHFVTTSNLLMNDNWQRRNCIFLKLKPRPLLELPPGNQPPANPIANAKRLSEWIPRDDACALATSSPKITKSRKWPIQIFCCDGVYDTVIYTPQRIDCGVCPSTEDLCASCAPKPSA
jgi:hypothetical protein